MDVTKILDKDKERFNKLNEQINSYIDTYGEKMAIAMVKNKLFEEGENNNPAPAPAPQPAQQNNNQQQADNQQTMLNDFAKIGQEFQEFIKKYPNAPQINDLNNILGNMRNVAVSMKGNNNQQQNNVQPAQQNNVQPQTQQPQNAQQGQQQ